MIFPCCLGERHSVFKLVLGLTLDSLLFVALFGLSCSVIWFASIGIVLAAVNIISYFYPEGPFFFSGNRRFVFDLISACGIFFLTVRKFAPILIPTIVFGSLTAVLLIGAIVSYLYERHQYNYGLARSWLYNSAGPRFFSGDRHLIFKLAMGCVTFALVGWSFLAVALPASIAAVLVISAITSYFYEWHNFNKAHQPAVNLQPISLGDYSNHGFDHTTIMNVAVSNSQRSISPFFGRSSQSRSEAKSNKAHDGVSEFSRQTEAGEVRRMSL